MISIKRIIATVALTTAISLYTNAQFMRVGLNYATMASNSSPYVEEGNLIRPTFSISTEGSEVGRFEMVMEYALSWQGRTYTYKQLIKDWDGGTHDVTTEYKTKTTYFNLPVLFKTTSSDKWFVEFGAYSGLLLSARRKGSTTIVNKTATGTEYIYEYDEGGRYGNKEIFPNGIDSKRPLKTYDFGAIIGFSYNLFGNGYVSLRWSEGLTDITQNHYPIKNIDKSREVNRVISVGLSLPLD